MNEMEGNDAIAICKHLEIYGDVGNPVLRDTICSLILRVRLLEAKQHQLEAALIRLAAVEERLNAMGNGRVR